MPAVVRKNERSWAIDLISKINFIVSNNDLMIKKAGGESTISTGRGNTMFPDVILYANQEQSVILQGWELKMPDVPIEDETFIKDAQRKAVALNLNSCLIWNFTYAVLYIRDNKNGSFRKVKQWNDTCHIRTREDVKTYRNDWENLLERIILEINGYFVSGEFHKAALGDIISNSAIASIIDRNKDTLAQHLHAAAIRDAKMGAFINTWWEEVKTEYEHDEADSYKAYAKTVILNWTNRILFAHIIKSRQNAALRVNDITFETSPAEADSIFSEITSQCDFYNVFSSVEYNELLPTDTWQDFVELSLFLKSNGIETLDQEALQNILEGTVATSKREINGQFTTPTALARILVRLTVRDWTDTMLDCCCGTGTIPKAAIQIKKGFLSSKDAIESVWACDKYKYPLQVANISMAGADTVNLANRLFQHNALTLEVGESVSIINPETGENIKLSLPSFGAVVSNLPFVPFEIIPGDDKAEIAKIPLSDQLDGRSDLYCYIAIKIADVLKSNGMLGIITSNSWLGTKAGDQFIKVLQEKYILQQVHISGKGRWFKNADVVTTIMILQKKAESCDDSTDFWLWKKSLTDFSQDVDAENTLVNSALLSVEQNPSIATLSRYTHSQIASILQFNVCYNALFHNVGWLLDIKDKIIPIHKAFYVIRGSRPGWQPMFYPKKGQHHIEPMYLRKVLLNARHTTTFMAQAEQDAFCCGASISQLKSLGHTGALAWIEKFSEQNNRVGKPLPKALKKKGQEWYEMKEKEIVEIFTMMNPNKRFFFARFETPSFVNQRLIGLNHKPDYEDMELNHALLNSIFTIFCIEAAGFGRGLGVLDINKDSIQNCYMLNPKLVSKSARNNIVQAFDRIKNRQIMNIADELRDDARLQFEHEVLRSFGIDEYFEKIKNSLLSMQASRATVKS